MPGQQLTDEQKAQVLEKLEANWPLAKVAADLKVSKSCIFYIRKRWQDQQRIKRPPRIGVGKVSTPVEDDILYKFFLKNPSCTVQEAREETQFPGSLRTLRRRLREAGLRRFTGPRNSMPSETTLQIQQRRLQFAKEFLNYDNDFWNNVVFSDAKTFEYCSNGRVRVCQPKNYGYDDILPTNGQNGEAAPSVRFSVHVWAWISVKGPGLCWRLGGPYTSEFYRDMLETLMLPSVTEVFSKNFIFQHENCPTHNPRIIGKWLERHDIVLLPWPARSADLHPMDDVWNHIVNKLHKRTFKVDTAKQLWRAIENAWDGLAANLDMKTSILSMPKRLEKVAAAHGAAT